MFEKGTFHLLTKLICFSETDDNFSFPLRASGESLVMVEGEIEITLTSFFSFLKKVENSTETIFKKFLKKLPTMAGKK